MVAAMDIVNIQQQQQLHYALAIAFCTKASYVGGACVCDFVHNGVK